MENLDRELIPPTIQLAYERSFDINTPPKNIRYKFSKKQGDKKIGIAAKGEMVVFYGAPKARKSTLLLAAIASAYTDDPDASLDFHLKLSQSEQILWFDTEMPDSYFYRRMAMLTKMCGFSNGENIPNFFSTYLKGMSYDEKLETIDYFITKYSKEGKVGVIVIDQIADLVPEINDRDAAREVIRYFEKWTILTNAMLFLAIHVTRGTKLMTGVLGSEVSKKMDSGIFMEKVYPSKNTRVEHLLSRGADMDDFEFNNNEFGYPILERHTEF